MSEDRWLIEFRLPEQTCWARSQGGRLGIAKTKKTARKFASAELAGQWASAFSGRLFQHAYVVEDVEEDGA